MTYVTVVKRAATRRREEPERLVTTILCHVLYYIALIFLF